MSSYQSPGGPGCPPECFIDRYAPTMWVEADRARRAHEAHTAPSTAEPIAATVRPRDGIRYYDVADLDPAFTTTLPGTVWTGTYGAANIAYRTSAVLTDGQSTVAYTTLVLRKLRKDGQPSRSRAESARVSVSPDMLRGLADMAPDRAAELRVLADRVDATVAAITQEG